MMRIAIVGAGGMGRAWAERIDLIDAARVAAFVDPLIGSMYEPTWLKDFPDTKVVSSLAELDSGMVEAVVVAAATPAHQEVILQALGKRLHVLVEKPFTTSLAGAQELVELACRNNCILMVSQNYRFLKSMQLLRKVITEGSFGHLRAVSCRFWCDHVGRTYQREMLHPMALEMAIHHFDLIRALSGAEAVFGHVMEWNSARSPYQQGGGIAASYQMEGGGLSFPFLYTGSLISTLPPAPWVGLWQLEFDQTTVIIDKVDGVYGIYRGVPSDYELLSLVELDILESLPISFEHFVSCINTGQEPWSSGRDNLLTLRMALGFL